jgi:hypothetical protein
MLNILPATDGRTSAAGLQKRKGKDDYQSTANSGGFKFSWFTI